MLNPNLQAGRYQRLALAVKAHRPYQKWMCYHVLSLGRMRSYLNTTYAMQMANLAQLEEDELEITDERSGYYKLGMVAYTILEACNEWEADLAVAEEMLGLPRWTETDQLSIEAPFEPDPGKTWSKALASLVLDGQKIRDHVSDLAEHIIDALYAEMKGEPTNEGDMP